MNTTMWGGSGIEKITFDYVSSKVKKGSVFVEIGAGKVSTREFSKIFNLYSVEQNKLYCDLYENVTYIFAPIENGWYNVDSLKNNLPKNISAIFVDGPSGEGSRDGFLENINLFDMNDDIMIIFHDTYRESELKLAQKVAHKLNMKVKEYSEQDFFAVVSNREDL